MGNATQQVKENPSPARYILVTVQQPCKDACVKRTGLLVGFGGKENTMIGLEIDKTLSFHESDVYAITKVEWNFGKKHRMKFFEPMQNYPHMDAHMKTKAFELVKRLFGNVVVKLGLDSDQYFSADKLYSHTPKHTAEEIVEPEITTKTTSRSTSSLVKNDPPVSGYPDGTGKTTYVPPKQPTTSYVTKTHKKDGPTMFRRSSTERVKLRVAAISARLDELFAIAVAKVQKRKEEAEAQKQKEEEERKAKESQNESAAPGQEQMQLRDLVKQVADFCVDCKKREDCSGDVDKVHYCSTKVPEKD